MTNRLPSTPSRFSSRPPELMSTLSVGIPLSVSVPVSEDDADDSNKKRRRRRFSSSSSAFWKGSSCFPRSWWLGGLLVIFCFWFLLFSPGPKASSHEAKKSGATKSKLNNLDMPTRRRNGTVEPCLKLLSVDEIEQLSYPPEWSDDVIKHIHYMSYYENGALSDESDGLKALPLNVNGNINLFTGNLTSLTRAASYKVGETVAVHCGFCHEHGGFDISPEDRQYLAKCEAVVVTCIFGGGDDLYQPIGMSNASLKKVCYVAFWDNVTVQAMEERGIEPHFGSGKIGHWRVVTVDNLPFSDQRRNGKIPKMLNHRLFPNARYSVWVDSKSQFRRDPLAVFEALLWRPQAVLAISQHGARDCVYEEGKTIVKKHKAVPEEVAAQLGQYEDEGLPRKAQVDGHKALAEASIIVREHTPRTNLFMCLWFNEPQMQDRWKDRLIWEEKLLITRGALEDMSCGQHLQMAGLHTVDFSYGSPKMQVYFWVFGDLMPVERSLDLMLEMLTLQVSTTDDFAGMKQACPMLFQGSGGKASSEVCVQ